MPTPRSSSPGRMSRRIPGRLAIAVATGLVSALLLAAEPAVGAKVAIQLAMSPDRAIPGEPMRVVGKLPTAGKRPIVLERRMGSIWYSSLRFRTKRNGSFDLTAPVSGGTSDYRIRAPRAKVGGKARPALVSPVNRVVPVNQTLSLTLLDDEDDVAYVGEPVAGQASFGPARPGRPALLQQRNGTTWTTIATSAQDAAGKAAFSFVPTAAGRHAYRVVADTFNGASQTPSFPVFLDVVDRPGPVTGS